MHQIPLYMGDGTQTHPGRGLRRQRRTPAAGAEKHKAFFLAKDRFVVGTFRIDPEFEHAARTVKGAGHTAFPVKLTDVANIDKGHVIAPMKGNGLLDRQRLDLALGGIDQRPKPGRDFLSHDASIQIVTKKRVRMRPGQCRPSLAATTPE
jgi:hypothetical protein